MTDAGTVLISDTHTGINRIFVSLSVGGTAGAGAGFPQRQMLPEAEDFLLLLQHEGDAVSESLTVTD